MSHKDKGRDSPIKTTYRGQNTNENCVPRDCKERVDGRYQTVCDQGAGIHAQHGYRRSAGASQIECARDLRCELALLSRSSCERGDQTM
jgi:hypothetical protein